MPAWPRQQHRRGIGSVWPLSSGLLVANIFSNNSLTVYRENNDKKSTESERVQKRKVVLLAPITTG